MKKSLSIVLSLMMIITSVSILPFTVFAGEGPASDGVIAFRDEFGAWGVDGYDYETNYDTVVFYAGEDVDTEYYFGESPVGIPYKGASYDKATNTFTLNNVNDPINYFMVEITNMGDLTINLSGTSKLWQIYTKNTNITFTGSGTLNINPPVSYTQNNGEYGVENEILGGELSLENGWVHIENGATVNAYTDDHEHGAISFSFTSPKTENELNNTYLKKGSATPSYTWGSSEYTNPAYDEPVPVNVAYVQQTFPATNLYELKGFQSEYKYWVYSEVQLGYKTLRPIYENADGVWVEHRFEGFVFKDDKYYAVHENTGTDSQPTDGIDFEKYKTTENMPSTLVTNNMATVCLLANNSYYSDELCTSGEMQFALHNRGWGSYRNESVEAVDPPANSQGGYDMYYIRKEGNTEYLQFCEPICNGYSTDTKNAVLSEKGYEAETVHYDEVTYYTYWIKGGTVTFKGGSHTHKYTSKVTKEATCGKDGIKTYTCSCGDTYTKTIKATGKHTPKDSGKITKTTSTTYTVTHTCKVCKKTYTVKYDKKANTLKASGKTAEIKYSSLKSKNQTVSQSKAFSVSKAKGKVTYTKSSGNAKITVSSAGKITVKKGLKKGTYKVKVKVKAAGNDTYKSATKTVTVTIKVK